MIQSTTPQITMTFPSTSTDLTTLGSCLVTIKQGEKVIELSGGSITVSAHSIVFSLSQEQTKGFVPYDHVLVQANFTQQGGSRVASNICEIDVSDNLHVEVIDE